MSSKRPLIGVTGPEKGGISAWLFTAAAVWWQGGRPFRIYPGKTVSKKIDGLILGGGADINPERYGELLETEEEPPPKPKGFRDRFIRVISILFYPLLFLFRNIFSTKGDPDNDARDALEFKLLEEACSKKIPILGICRGSQLINVHFGGSLHQEIADFYSEVPKIETVRPRKKVSIETGSRLHQLLGRSEVRVNALHHQAVDSLGEEIEITARDEAGIIQGIEHPGFDFLIGVQWHPEYLPQIESQRRLFKELVERAGG